MLAALLGARAVHAEASAPWTPGPGAVGDDTYVGFVDSPGPGTAVTANQAIQVRGWIVDQSAEGWAGIDQVQVLSGVMDQGGRVLAMAGVAQDRPDVGQALANPYFAASGFSATVPAGALPPGPSTLNLYVHSPGKGWWFRPLSVQIQQIAVAPRPYSDDPLVVVDAPLADARVAPSDTTLTVRGFALDRNSPGSGVGRSGVSHVQLYLDGTRRDGVFLGEAQLGLRSRGATGFGEAFDTAGWEIQIHPNEFAEEPHALFIYATSATSPAESLVIVPFRIEGR
jgi:hypothetical protein